MDDKANLQTVMTQFLARRHVQNLAGKAYYLRDNQKGEVWLPEMEAIAGDAILRAEP